jgi:predicted Fe-S protein YdhL (DUF1289 family)
MARPAWQPRPGIATGPGGSIRLQFEAPVQVIFSNNDLHYMSKVKTPCIGICSTTSLGDRVCRGCKRYGFEVINWNGYEEEAKAAVLRRIEKLVCQILEDKCRIFSVPNLKLGLEQLRVPFDPELAPYCWLHNLLKKKPDQVQDLKDFGAYLLPGYAHLSLQQLSELVEEELLLLSDAHYQRYYEIGAVSSSA